MDHLHAIPIETFMTNNPIVHAPHDTMPARTKRCAATTSGTRKLVGIASYVDVLKEIVKFF